MSNKQAVQVVSPGSENYDVVLANGRSVARFDWEGFAKKYNGAKVESILIAAIAHPKLSNIHKVLRNRGLKKDVDYTVALSGKELNRSSLITKLTKRKLKYLNEL